MEISHHDSNLTWVLGIPRHKSCFAMQAALAVLTHLKFCPASRFFLPFRPVPRRRHAYRAHMHSSILVLQIWRQNSFLLFRSAKKCGIQIGKAHATDHEIPFVICHQLVAWLVVSKFLCFPALLDSEKLRRTSSVRNSWAVLLLLANIEPNCHSNSQGL